MTPIKHANVCWPARSNHPRASDERQPGPALRGRGSAGRVAERLSSRPGQLELAENIHYCLEAGQDLVAEAATGTGKTLAYLLPVLERAQRTIISTGTLNLQEQLYRRDLPLALKVTGRECKTALLKGRAITLCPQRLEMHLGDDGLLGSEVAEELQLIKRWADHTRTGGKSARSTRSAKNHRSGRWSPPPRTTVSVPIARSSRTAHWPMRAARPRRPTLSSSIIHLLFCPTWRSNTPVSAKYFPAHRQSSSTKPTRYRKPRCASFPLAASVPGRSANWPATAWPPAVKHPAV